MAFDFLTVEERSEADHAVDRAARWVLIGLLVLIGAVVALTAFS